MGLKKIISRDHWDKLTYGLIYPGFVGSMIYELIPSSSNDISKYISIDTAIKYVITFFYCVDYYHLYGDMHELTEGRRSDRYVLCDIASSSLFFGAFVSVKLHHYCWALSGLAVVPLCFLIYKMENENDRWFFFKYTPLSIALAVFLLLFQFRILKIDWLSNCQWNLLGFSLLSLLTYSYYVVWYYDKYSLKDDLKLYPIKAPEGRLKRQMELFYEKYHPSANKNQKSPPVS